jgi:nucleoside-diphosphate-sugar epimerase
VLRHAASSRAALAANIVDALGAMPADERPLYISVSGVAELVPDRAGRRSANSQVAQQPRGYGVIGAAVRDAVRDSGVATTFVHLGTVYGPGKFTERVVPGLRARRLPVIGSGKNHVSLIHVADAARAMIHLSAIDRSAVDGHQWVVTDGTLLTQRELLETSAAMLGAPSPRCVPRWVGALAVGGGLVNELTKDAPSDPGALIATGWRPEFPTFASGFEATLRTLDSERLAS